ncbi:MAG: substrate-binding domain-containing protein [Planctomycetota bacterium]|jgi:DNA-binding LacI/PurR family transcriptional regulator
MGREKTFIQHTPLLYERVSQAIRDQIDRGRLAPGDRLPPIRTLSCEFGCNYHTVRRALGVLEREGVVKRVLGSGTFVRRQSWATGRPATPSRARKGRRARHTSVCALLPDVRNLYLGKLILQLQKQAEAEDVDLTFDVFPGIDMAEIGDRYPSRPGFDAAILPWFRERDRPEVCGLLQHFEVPVVTHLPVSGHEAYCYKTPTILGEGSHRAVRMACDYFRALGTKHIVLVGPFRTGGFEFQNRLAEYTRVMNEIGAEVRVFLAGGDPADYQRVIDCAQSLEPPVGAIAYYDELAIHLLNVLNRQQIAVPSRVAVLGFNNSQGCETTLPPLSSMEPSFEFIARGMLRHARALAAGKADQVNEIEPIRIVVRESCGGRALSPRRLDALLKRLESQKEAKR